MKPGNAAPTVSPNGRAPAVIPGRAEIQAWLVARIAELADCPPESIDVGEPFDSFGLASRDVVALSGELEDWLHRRLSPTVVYEYPSIEALSRYLAEGEPAAHAPTAAAPRPAEAAPRPQAQDEPIAIIGLGCRFPGADGPAAFWDLLHHGVDAVGEAPPDRWDLTQLYDPEPGVPGKLSTRWGGFLDRIDAFDAQFFGISPREASRIDPQQRLLLEVTWEALEHAGLPPERLAGSQSGVFVGISSNDYALLQYGDRKAIDAYAGTGNASSIAANRLSYVFDLRGPSIAIDTACSSSLVAVHLACRSLRSGETDVALAGGVNVMATPELTITFSHAHMMAADGHCKTFDAAADGYVRGEGCGVVVLKRLSDAVRDGDRVLALVRGSAINQDGRSNGLTAPNGLAQQAVVRAALSEARVAPEDLGYVEAHGTGTALGDPIEVSALGAVLAGRSQEAPCVLGSVKTNIGHLEAAAGVAGLIKVVLSLVNQSIPPHLHFRQANPYIPLASLPLTIPTEPRPWPAGGRRRVAGVSSFGFGGTNAHLIVEEAPAPVARTVEARRPRHVLALSARDELALRDLAGRYVAHLARRPEMAVEDLCYSANTGRSHFPARLAVTAGDRAELEQALAAAAAGAQAANLILPAPQSAARPKVAFLFTGQGSQYAGMGRTLYETQPVFRETLDRCAAILDQELDHPLLELLFAEHERAVGAPAGTHLRGPLDQTANTQPALFALEYALAQLWMSWGIRPDAVMGHSVGEYVAACVAGVFSLEDGLRLIARRGRLMQSLPPGGMMAAVFADASTVGERIRAMSRPGSAPEEELAIAAINGPRSTVISGRAEAVQALVASLADDGVETRAMATSHAFHSPLMEPILAEFEEAAREVRYAAPQIPLVSNLSGQLLGGGEVQDAAYWRQHIREPVQFLGGMEALREAGCTAFVEIGPQPHLTGMGRYCLSGADLAWLPSLKAGQDDWAVILEGLARLYVAGAPVDWSGFDRPYGPQQTDLPTYPFRRERHWIEMSPREMLPTRRQVPAAHPLLGQRLASPLPITQFEARLSGSSFPGHKAGEYVTVAEPTFLELAQAAARASFGPGTRSAIDLSLHEPLVLNGEVRTLQTLLAPGEAGLARFEMFSRPDDDETWIRHAAGSISYVVDVLEEPAALKEPARVEAAAAPSLADAWSTLMELPPAERLPALAACLRDHLAAVLRCGAERIGLEQPLTGLGLDSIMAIELKAAVERSLHINIPVASLLMGPSISDLAAQLIEQVVADHQPLRPDQEDEKPSEFPLAYGQRALWFQHQVAPASVFNPVYAARLRARLDLEALRAAFQMVVDRHPALRTTFRLVDGEPMQVIGAGTAISLRHEVAPGLSEEATSQRLNAFAQEPFDLEAGPLFRVYVLSVGPEEHLLAMASHHLVTDLWSQAIIVHEVGQLYGTPALAGSLARPGLHLSDYVRWQRELLAGAEGERLWDYWRQKLAGELPLLNLPTARPRPPVQTFNGDRRALALGPDLTGRLRAVSERAGATLYATLLAAFDVLLYRYTGQTDIVVGTAATGRSQTSMADVVGYFVNSLPVRAALSAGQPFSALLAQVRQSVVEAVAHQDYPLPLLVERLRLARDLSRTPLFQVMFVFQRAHLLNDEGLSGFAIGGASGRLSLGPLSLESVPLGTRGAPFDLTLMMVEAEHGLQAELTYNTDLFDGEAIERMLAHLAVLLEGVAADADMAVDRLPLLPAAERRLVLEQLNATETALPIDQPIQALFEAQVARRPGAVAVVESAGTRSGDREAPRRELTYAELDARANQLAHHLRQRGVGPEVLVAVSLERSVEMVVAVLGVLKAGGAYVPIDPAYPEDRIHFMLADARPAALLTTADLAERMASALDSQVQPALVLLDEEWPLIAVAPTTAPVSGVSASDLAYVIYTSGSTGRPKGVMIEHRGLCNLVLAQIEGFGLTEASRVLQFASFSFDASVSEIFTTLVSGARLHLAGRETLLSSTGLPRLIREEEISVVTLPPSLLALLRPEDLPGLRTLVSAGEALPVEQARRWGVGRRLINAYGPTEATVGPTMFDTAALAPDAANVPIGRPIANMQIFILDGQGQPAPLGVPGEVHIGGVGLARGYLNRPDLTAERFLELGIAPSRLYRTGDLARLRPDGNIEYLGRVDHQVKIRGLRIELGEIEEQLRAHLEVREACVVAREDRAGDKRLVAYVVPRSPGQPRGGATPAEGAEPGGGLSQQLRTYLLARLPDFMVPAAFVELEALPLTPNGKVDQRALPAPGSRQAHGPDGAPPQNELERSLAEIWKEALGVERVGRNDNFFELGGHSLLMVKVHGQIQELLGHEISIVELFRYPTITVLAKYLSREPDAALKAQAVGSQRAAQQRAALQQQQLLQQQRMQAVGQARRAPGRRG